MSAVMTGNLYAQDSNQQKPLSPTSSIMQVNQRSYRNIAHSDTKPPLAPLKYQPYTPAEPPTGMSYRAFVTSWIDDDVSRWLNEIRCGCHNEAFKVNDIRGDVILELDQVTLQEMGIASIGDRLRILNAVKTLRQRVSAKAPSPALAHHASGSVDYDAKTADHTSHKPTKNRLESFRPAPLQLNANAALENLPAIIREQAPDSARSVASIPPIRPLPHPTQQTSPPSNSQLTTPSSSAHSASLRPGLPPLPPPPRGQPPLPPGRTPNRPNHQWTPGPTQQQDLSQQQSQNSGLLTPSTNNWVNHHLPADPRPGNPGSKVPFARSTSPALPAPRVRPGQTTTAHGRNGSVGTHGSPHKRPANSHPYANALPAALHPPTSLLTNLSPIDESFSSHVGTTPSPPTQGYTVGRGPFASGTSNGPYTLDDLRRKLVKFVLPDEGHSTTIDVASCHDGVEVLEKVLKKFGKGSLRSDGHIDVSHTEGGLTVDGWGVFMDLGQEDGPGMFPASAQSFFMLIFCSATFNRNGAYVHLPCSKPSYA